MIDLGSLRLSAQRAFLDKITPSMRLIKVESINGEVILSCLTDAPPTPVIKELISDAAAEIISDFPEVSIKEIVKEHQGKLPLEDIVTHGGVYAGTRKIGMETNCSDCWSSYEA